MKSTTIAVDVAKEILEVAVSVRPGQVREQKRLTRTAFMKFCTDQPPATVLLEACGSSHYWGRRLQGLGHRVVLLPPHATRPYVFRNKTDRADTRGLLEAYRNEDIHPVPVKSVPQQALTALHRLRSTWLAARTARLNTVRGLLREFGCIIPVGAHHVLPRTWDLLADADSGLPDALRPALAETCTEIRALRTASVSSRPSSKRSPTRLPSSPACAPSPASVSSPPPPWSPSSAMSSAFPPAATSPATWG